MDTIHGFVYNAVLDICFDREYVYACFLRTFAQLTGGIYKNGGLAPTGSITARGIKSDYDAVFSWSLARRVSFLGSNEVELRYALVDKAGSRVRQQKSAVFDVSTGEQLTVAKGE